jgi:outer membrane receptor protein involved in Fe transport
MNLGLHLSGFLYEGDVNWGLEPRFASTYQVNDRFSVKASYARMFQYVHLVANSGIALPTDIWYPTTDLVKPQISDQVAAGGVFKLSESLLLTNEYYYKWLDNQIEFRDHAQLFANDNLEEEFAFGDGFAYGMEFGIEKTKGKLKGWLGYTLTFIRRGNFELVDGGQIMEGRYFPPRYDRRHDISLVGIYDINRKLTVTGTFVYGSGDISWLPSGRFFFQDVNGQTIDPAVPVFEDRNTFRLPPYYRLDLGLMIKFFPKWGENNLTISVYNVLNRRNPYFVYIEPEFEDLQDIDGNVIGEVYTGSAAKQVSLFPILPSITWNFTIN